MAYLPALSLAGRRWRSKLRLRIIVKLLPILALSVVSIFVASPQVSQDKQPEFEVAAIKVGPKLVSGFPPVSRGGPGTGDPGRIFYSGVSMMDLLTRAYNLYPDQIIGPNWLISETYTITANVPSGASKEDLRLMIQNLLSKRFKLTAHREEKDFAVYSLSVGKGGQKGLRKTTSAQNSDPTESESDLQRVTAVALDKNGCPITRPGVHMAAGGIGTNNCSAFRKYSMADFAKFLEMVIAMETGSYYGSQASQAHVVDNTGLVGEYDFDLKFTFNPVIIAPRVKFAPISPSSGPDIFSAVEKQLGLELKEGKARLTVLAIDDLLKVPTDDQ